MRIIDHGCGSAGNLPAFGEASVGTPAGAPDGGIEVTPAMIWAALEEWAGFDEARDDLERFLAGVYRVMETVRREAAGAHVPAVTYTDLRYLP